MPTWPDDENLAESMWPAIIKHLQTLAGSYDPISLSDHVGPPQAWLGPSLPALDAWTSLVHYAAAFPAFRFGNMVMNNSFRHPALLAKAAATSQFLTGGRIVPGLGAGLSENENRAYGYEYPSNGVRIRQLDESLHIIRRMWTDSPATFSGKYYRIENAYCEPPRGAIHILQAHASRRGVCWGPGCAAADRGHLNPSLSQPLARQDPTIRHTIDEDAAVATLHAALEEGIRLIDTALLYLSRQSERVVARALRESPDLAAGLVVETKCCRLPEGRDYWYDGPMRSVEGSLERLGMERIELLYIHDPPKDLVSHSPIVPGRAIVHSSHTRALQHAGLECFARLTRDVDAEQLHDTDL